MEIVRRLYRKHACLLKYSSALGHSTALHQGILEVLDEEGPLKSLRVDDSTKWGRDADKLLSTKNWHVGLSGRAV